MISAKQPREFHRRGMHRDSELVCNSKDVARPKIRRKTALSEQVGRQKKFFRKRISSGAAGSAVGSTHLHFNAGHPQAPLAQGSLPRASEKRQSKSRAKFVFLEQARCSILEMGTPTAPFGSFH